MSAALVVGTVSPVTAAEPGGSPEAPQLGGFAVGDGLEGLIGEQDGSLQLSLPVGGVTVGWDSRRVDDRYGLGRWAWNLGHVEVDGGVRATLASGQTFERDASSPSGLLGYHADDVKFVTGEGRMEARRDALGDSGVRSIAPGDDGQRAYAFVMHELGGSATYYDAAGDPVVRRTIDGGRVDLIWDDEVAHRLLGVVSPDGVSTRLEWSPDGAVSITRGANVRSPAPGARVARSVWRLEPGPGGIASVVDPTGAVLRIEADDTGLLTRLRGASGSVTEVSWAADLDGALHVDTVRTTDGADGRVLSERTWRAGDGRMASGWPAIGDTGYGIAAVAGGYETVLSDGPTSIVSEYDQRHLLTSREVRSSTESGERVVQTQQMHYPKRSAAEAAGGGPAGGWNRPSSIELVYRDETGRSRTESTSFVFDQYGREVERRDADGRLTRTTYDPASSGSELPPVGLPTLVRTETADGLVSETRHGLNDARTQVERTETWSGSGDELTLTGRTDVTLDPDGFVTERHVFPQGGAGDPVVTTYERSVDATAGTITVSQTAAAGTSEAVTTTAVTDIVSGQPLRHTDAVGNTTSVEYDELGRVVAQTDAIGRTVRTEYRTALSDGVNAVTVTTPALVTRTEEHDVLGRVIRVTDNIKDGVAVEGHARVSETRTYPDAATVVRTDAWGAQTRTRKDVLGRVIETVAPTGATQVTRYDDLERTSETGITVTGDLADAESVASTRSDVRGAAVETTGWRADEVAVPTVRTSRDGFGRVLSSSDGRTATAVQLDAFSNPVTTTITGETGAELEAAGRAGSGGASGAAGLSGAAEPPGPADAGALVETREFDAFGTSIEKVLSSDGESRSGGRQRLDVLGRTVAETDQRGSTDTIHYTPDGLVQRRETGFGAVTEHRYDPKTRALLESVMTSPTGATVRTAFAYDPITGAMTEVFDPADRDATEISTEYDAWGNQTRLSYPDGKVIEYEHDGNGRRIATIDVAGNRTDFTYDRAGLLVAAEQTDADNDPIASARYEYDELGRMIELVRGNGVRTAYEFTSADQIAAETTTGPDGGLHAERRYTYDARGQLTARTDVVGADTVGAEHAGADNGAAADPVTTTYEYDLHGRLTASTVQGGATAGAADPRAQPTRTEYELTVGGDIAGERRATADGSELREFEYSPTGELLAVTTDGDRREQVYDAAGNLILGVDGSRYVYDAMHRPIEEVTPKGETITIRYWADGSRRELASGSAATGFYWDGDTLLNDTHTRDGATWQTAGYLIGAERHARSLTGALGGDVQYSVTDRHGNVTALTAADGRTSARYSYTDYGVVTVSGRPEASAHDPGVAGVGDATRQPFLYAGAYADPTGDLHLAIRAYDADTARLREEDPEGLHNRYAYANLNPITLVDPTGRYAQPDAVTGVLGGLSLVFSAISIGAAIVTGGASLAGIGAFGLTADIAGMILAATLIADKAVAQPFLPKNVREGLEIAELALIPIGVAGAIADGYLAFKATRPALASDELIEMREPLLSRGHEPEVPIGGSADGVPGAGPGQVPAHTVRISQWQRRPWRRPWKGPAQDLVREAPVVVVPPGGNILRETVFPKFHGLSLPSELMEQIHWGTQAIRGHGYDSFDTRPLMEFNDFAGCVLMRIGGNDQGPLQYGQVWPEWALSRWDVFLDGAKHIVKYADLGYQPAISAERQFNELWQSRAAKAIYDDLPTLRQVAAYR